MAQGGAMSLVLFCVVLYLLYAIMRDDDDLGGHV